MEEIKGEEVKGDSDYGDEWGYYFKNRMLNEHLDLLEDLPSSKIGKFVKYRNLQVSTTSSEKLY